LPSPNAFAQSSLGAPINAATGRSLTDAVSQNEKELIDREVLGADPAGRSTAGGGGGGTAAVSVFPTGRLRTSDHDGLRPPADDHFSYKTTEASVFGNIVVAVPGTVLGGQVKVSGFVGRNELSLDLKSNDIAVLDPNQSGSARNDSVIAGGTVLWSQKNTYALATIVGTWGQTTLKDSVDDCGYASPPHPTGCNHNRYNFNTSGFIGTVTAGQVFDLAGASGPKLDLRGSVGYTHNVGDRFANVFGDQQKYTFSTWTGTGAVTLFSNLTLQDNALLRPYIQGYIRQEWGYRNEFDFLLTDGTSGTVREDQKHFYGGVDAGLTYTQGSTTFGAAIYYEASGDERTLGGRLGMSQKLDGAVAAAQAKGFTWSGFFVGVNAGRAWGDARTSTSVVCLDPAQVDCPFTLPSQFAAIGAAGSGTMSDRGFVGGVQAGYNLQTGSLVFGLEVDVQSFRLAASRSVTTQDPNNVLNSITVGTSFDTDWLFTARGRLGWAVAPNALLYVTGGVAATELGVSNSLSSSVSGAQGAGSASGLVTGWAVGGGTEWALSRNWTLRAEYLYMDFGKVTANAPVSDPAAGFNNNMATTVDLTAQIVRAGINYKF
jgi:outer membrane immunogenic protein